MPLLSEVLASEYVSSFMTEPCLITRTMRVAMLTRREGYLCHI